MNLYEYSQVNNHEIGIIIDATENKAEYKDTLHEINLILKTANNSLDFSKLIENIEDYSMGRLFNELIKNYTFKLQTNNREAQYLHICNLARRIITFENHELYQDKTAILRGTNLGKDRFDLLMKKIKEFAV